MGFIAFASSMCSGATPHSCSQFPEIGPGASALTRISGATSRARAAVNPRIAPLAAQYVTGTQLIGLSALTPLPYVLEKLTITPRPCRRSNGITACDMRIVPTTSTIRSAVAASGGHRLEPNRVRLIEPPGRVHEHVDPSVRLVRACDETVDRFLIGDVEPVGVRRAACGHDLGGNRLRRCLRASIAEDDRGALPTEPRCHGPAECPACARHQRDSARETAGRRPDRLHRNVRRQSAVQAAAVVTTSANSSWRLMAVIRAIAAAGTTSPSGAVRSNVCVASRTNHTS